MPESTLTLDQFQLEAEVGDYAGYGLGARFENRAWTTDQQSRITRSVHSGLRSVYFTQEMEGIPGAYEWSFLRPTSELTLAEDSSSLLLPDDFGGIQGDIIPASTSGESQFPIAITGPGELYKARSLSSDCTGRPMMAFVEAIKGTSLTKSNRYRLQVYPIADQDYTLRVWYYLLPNATSASLPHVYGGAAHAETFKWACKAAYAMDFEPGNPETPVTVGRFVERLRASIAYDRRFKPVTIGRNRDYSDDVGCYEPHLLNEIAFDVNGVSPG